MGTVISDIRASGGDYATIKAWVDAVNAGTISGYTAGDTVIGEVTGSVNLFTGNANVTLTATGPAGVILRAAAGQKHTGIPGTGATIVHDRANYAFSTNAASQTFTIQELEFASSLSANSSTNLFTHQAGTCVIDRCIFQGDDVYTRNYVVQCSGAGLTVQNSVLLKKSGAVIYMLFNPINFDVYVLNCTVDGGSVGVYSLYKNRLYAKNTVAMNTSTADFAGAIGSYPAFTDYNASEDATAPGTNSLINLTRANQYVDPANYDFHLLSTADLVGAGFDLGTTYNSEQDIDEYDRDAGGVVWDIGADQYVAGGGGIVVPVAVSHLRQQGIM